MEVSSHLKIFREGAAANGFGAATRDSGTGRMFGHQSSITVAERSQVGEARREGQRLAELAGFSELDAGRAAVVIAELATNLARHATGGRILLSHERTAGRTSLVILAIDSGPGMGNVSACLTDGYSTGGTPGNGLGAVQRISSEFDVYSSVPGGTVLYSRIDAAPMEPSATREAAPFAWGVVCQPLAHETACGDSWRIAAEGRRLSVLMVDGLGHGPEAAAAAAIAGETFEENSFAPATTLLNAAHDRMRGSRGGAVSVAQLDADTGSLKYVGVGNISGSVIPAGETAGRGLFSHNGIVGVQTRKVQEFSYDALPGALLILHSDGLQGRWSLAAYPGLAQRHPAVIAGALYRDFQRGRDDVTVAVIRRTLSGGRG